MNGDFDNNFADCLEYETSYQNNKVDYLLSITAMLQPVLTIIQLFLIDAMYMDPESANRIRVLTTALPIIFSMVIVFKRNSRLATLSYLVVWGLLMTGVMIPGRWKYMSNDVLKFTLPVVVPVGLCISSVKNFAVLIKSMQIISLVAAVVGFFYALFYLSGVFTIEGYSMAFSYALLFPTLILISRKHFIWKCVAIILMLEMLAIGSRGALMLSVAYWAFNSVYGKISMVRIFFYSIFFISVYFFFFDSILLMLSNLFESIGINSRTLRLLIDDEIVSHDSGRDEIYQQTWRLIDRAPLLGNGVWADRQYLEVYCHNVFLELLLDFGYIGTGLILIIFCIEQFRIFIKIPFAHKKIYFILLGVLCPLFASASYLTSFNLGMFLGFTYLLSKMYDNRLYQDYIFK